MPLIDDEALVLGIKWRFLRANGLEYGEAYREYVMHIDELIGSETPKKTLSLAPTPSRILSPGYVPDSNFGS